MAENSQRTKGLTSTQEGLIAGLVLLSFGLVYWYLNPWQSEQQAIPILAKHTTNGTIQSNSLASTGNTQVLASTTEALPTTNILPPPPGLVKASNTENSTLSTKTAETTQLAQSTTSIINKLEFAPGSPEAKLQTYLENKTLETPVGIDGINFEAKTTKLTKNSEAKVLMLAALLAHYSEANFLITTYTTETSAKHKNSDDLSLMRAQALGENLVKAGINGKRITIMGMGKRPSPDKTVATAKKSQRIEISVIQ